MISWLLFPAVVCGVLGGALFALGEGVAPSAVVGFGTLASILLVVAFERIQPFHPDWNHSKGDLVTDALYLPTYLGVNALIEPGVRVAAVAVGTAVSAAIGLGLWPDEWSLFAQLALACVIVEAFDYWPHRLLHEVPWLWRFHAIHHNPKRLYWLNAQEGPDTPRWGTLVRSLPIGGGEKGASFPYPRDRDLVCFQQRFGVGSCRR